MQDRFEAFTVLIAKISRSIRRIKADEMAEYDLKATHVNCLYYLYTAGGMTAAELCEKCEEDKAAISRSLEYLEANGFVTTGGAQRRYKTPLHLTPRGWEVSRAIHARIEHIVAQASGALSEAERETMYRALERISTNLDEICARREKAGAGMEEA